MTQHALLVQETYNPNRLLDELIERLNLKNDAALARVLSIAPPVISKVRHARLPVGASMLMRMHEESGLSIRELRELMGDRRERMRVDVSDTRLDNCPPLQRERRGRDAASESGSSTC